MEQVWRPELAWWEFVLRCTVVYIALWSLLRLTGKRQIGQLGILDLVLVLLVANAVQNAMVGADTSLTGGLIAAAVLVGLNWAFNRAEVSAPFLRRITLGTPMLLVHDGELVLPNLRREGVTPEEIQSQVREHGIEDLSQVHSAVLEPDGTISVIPAGAKVYRGHRRVRQFKRGV